MFSGCKRTKEKENSDYIEKYRMKIDVYRNPTSRSVKRKEKNQNTAVCQFGNIKFNFLTYSTLYTVRASSDNAYVVRLAVTFFTTHRVNSQGWNKNEKIDQIQNCNRNKREKFPKASWYKKTNVDFNNEFLPITSECVKTRAQTAIIGVLIKPYKYILFSSAFICQNSHWYCRSIDIYAFQLSLFLFYLMFFIWTHGHPKE